MKRESKAWKEGNQIQSNVLLCWPQSPITHLSPAEYIWTLFKGSLHLKGVLGGLVGQGILCYLHLISCILLVYSMERSFS